MSDKTKIDYVELKKEILRASGGGLDIIDKLYGSGPDGFNPKEPKKKFNIRNNDKTASAAAHQSKGVWGVIDFGDPSFGSKMKSAIDMWMIEKNLEFTEALLDLASIFTVEVAAGKYQARRPDYEKIKVSKRPDPHYKIETKSKPEIHELAAFNQKCLKDKELAERFAEVLENFNMFALDKYTSYDENGTGHVWKSTPAFPIFASQRGSSWKVYKPYELDKKWRFQWFGNKPKGFVFGLQQVEEYFKEKKEEYQENLENQDKLTSTIIKNKVDAFKLDEIVIASGESDCINFWAYVSVPSVCLDSETSILTTSLYIHLKSMAKKIYLCYDLDETGTNKAKEICLEYVDIHWIKLPQELTGRKDWRQTKCKDFKNWCENYDPWLFRHRLLPVDRKSVV